MREVWHYGLSQVWGDFLSYPVMWIKCIAVCNEAMKDCSWGELCQKEEMVLVVFVCLEYMRSDKLTDENLPRKQHWEFILKADTGNRS